MSDGAWTANGLRKLLSNSKGLQREQCFICGQHVGITELHHLIQVSELADLLNKGALSFSDVKTPVVWLCPNCHAYVHAGMRGDTDTVLPMFKDSVWFAVEHVVPVYRGF